MKQVAKLLIIDGDDRYLLLRRSDHPTFGRDADLPGGTLEAGESMLETMIREVEEEIGVTIGATMVEELYVGADYSAHSTQYAFYVAKLPFRPEITISWEHESYEWITRDKFIEKSKNAQDTYMHMVADVITARKDEL